MKGGKGEKGEKGGKGGRNEYHIIKKEGLLKVAGREAGREGGREDKKGERGKGST